MIRKCHTKYVNQQLKTWNFIDLNLSESNHLNITIYNLSWIKLIKDTFTCCSVYMVIETYLKY